MKTKLITYPFATIRSFIYVFVFIGSLSVPFITIFNGINNLLAVFDGKTNVINAYSESRLWLGDQVFNRSIVDHDHWVNLTDGYALTGYQNVQPLQPSELAAIYKSLEDFRTTIEAKGSVFLFVIPPDKQSIYPEHVPAQIPRNDGPSRLDQLIAYIDSKNRKFPLLDLRPVLLNAKKASLVYYATDTHWNPIGAFLAYQAMLEALQHDYPNLTPHALSDYELVSENPTLFNMSKIIGSTSLVETPIALKPTYKTQATEFSFEFPVRNGVAQLYFTRVNDLSAPSAVIFTDSFFTSLRPFVSEHFSRALYINHAAAAEISYMSWYDQFPTDIVIFEITERNLGSIPVLLDH